jgi:D-alanyl-lipoteichoic acid acyltransferase DltB (MBOAT superfamily)
MLFHTPTFLIFFAVFCAFYFSTSEQRVRLWVVLLFSNVFYGWWSWKYLALLWFTVLVDYLIAKKIQDTQSKKRKKLFLYASLSCNLVILCLFKYFNFFINVIEESGVDQVNDWYIHNLILPAGLSFYTFQSMSYTIDVYRGKQAAMRSLLQYAAFVCYFPQLVAGPIERASHLVPMILAPLAPTRERLSSGIFLFCLGFFRKSVADVIAQMVDPIFSDLPNASPVAVVCAIFGFGMQVYLDFSGYTDMARGVSKVMGIDLMINFRAPYLSCSPQEFWRRWHISLSQWLRDYLYIPLGGNRAGEVGHLMNLMITMLLGGLWHGAGLNFLFWGGLHGFYLCIHSVLSKYYEKSAPFLSNYRFLSGFCSWFVTWICINYAWLYFRCSSFDAVMLANHKIGSWLLHPELPQVTNGIWLLFFILLVIDLANRFLENRPLSRLSCRMLLLQDMMAAFFFTSGFILTAGVPTQQFIYFNF